VCHILTPSLLIIGPGELRENSVRTPGMDQEPTRRHHVAAAHWPPQGWFSRTVGSADPLWATRLCAFMRWLLGGSSSRFQVSMGFGGNLDTFVGHRIHVMHTCQLLIHPASLPWTDDINVMWYLVWQPLIGWDLGAWIDEVEE
jgi:hypothetical protein